MARLDEIIARKREIATLQDRQAAEVKAALEKDGLSTRTVAAALGMSPEGVRKMALRAKVAGGRSR